VKIGKIQRMEIGSFIDMGKALHRWNKFFLFVLFFCPCVGQTQNLGKHF
jgi:hypothetical protein